MRQPIPETKRIRIMILDDYPLVADCLRLVLGREPDLLVCEHRPLLPETIRDVWIARADVLLVGIEAQPARGLALVGELARRWPSIPVVVVSGRAGLRAQSVIDVGASGFVAHSEGSASLIAMVRKVVSRPPGNEEDPVLIRFPFGREGQGIPDSSVRQFGNPQR